MTFPTTSIHAGASAVANATEVKQAFTDFIGQTFFSQMMKAMRSSQGKPAYFHGGQAEEVFQGQLDQTLAEVFTESTADQFAGPIFEHQFPNHARVLQSSLAASDQSIQ